MTNSTPLRGRDYQRGKTLKLLFGDMNTKYFHLVANGKHRKTRIFQLVDGDKIIQGDEELKKHITYYYRGLFGPSDPSFLSLDESRRDDIPQVTDIEKDKLQAMFSYEEVRAAVFQMEDNKALGPDGYPTEFMKLFGTPSKLTLWQCLWIFITEICCFIA